MSTKQKTKIEGKYKDLLAKAKKMGFKSNQKGRASKEQIVDFLVRMLELKAQQKKKVERVIKSDKSKSAQIRELGEIKNLSPKSISVLTGAHYQHTFGVLQKQKAEQKKPSKSKQKKA